MKIFSKGNKANRSTPLINNTCVPVKHFSSSKAKNSGKLTIFKKLLCKSSNELGLLSEKYIPEVAFCSKPIQNALQKNKGSDSGKSLKYNRSRDISPNKVLASKDFKINKTQADCRSTSDSIQKIGSNIHYVKIGQNKEINQIKNKAYNNFIQKQTNNPIQANNLSIKDKPISPICQKPNQNIVANKQNQSKKMNHYKNTRLNFYNSKPTGLRKWSLSCFKLGRKVGRGRFGCVYMAQQTTTGFICALKLIDIKQVRDQEMQAQIIQEIKLQLYLKHAHILKMYGFFREDNQICMILEYAEDRCLFHKLVGMMEQKNVAKYTKQMITALKYCHSESVLHRDLKPQNILLSFGVAKLADFGWAAYAPKYKRITFCGTLDYVPPQILNGQQYDERVDIWSLGVLIYEMATGKAPFQSPSINPSHAQAKTMKRIKQGNLNISSTLSSGLHKLINLILKTQPSQRPSLQQIQQNSWFKINQPLGDQINIQSKDLWVQYN